MTCDRHPSPIVGCPDCVLRPSPVVTLGEDGPLRRCYLCGGWTFGPDVCERCEEESYDDA